MSSYKNINYRLRPAKHIERKMLAEAFGRLTHFARIETYRYVGLGSPYFSDFLLFHRLLGFKTMISIEKEKEDQARFEFNKPFKCVSMVYGNTKDKLPGLSWTQRTILWLDYDGVISLDVLADIRTFVVNACSGSVLVVTLNSHPQEFRDLPAETRPAARLAALKESLAGESIPDDIEPKSLSDWGLAAAYRRIILNKIRECLVQRNAGKNPEEKFEFSQIFNFRYRDGARMSTFGGVIFDEGNRGHFNSCSFGSLEYVRNGEEPHEIQVPCLTFKEARFLDERLPADDPEGIASAGIDIDDVKKYKSTYRWFPHFVESEL
ncbi:MAG: hypothetical protein KIS92_08125 [Planctomycetota bacterium]|nr:hypothetical protein [Planctomycetota bacterium]